MDVRPIHTEKEYKVALSRIEALMEAAPGSPEADELEVLSTLVDVYEKEHFPIEAPDPIEAIKLRMDQMGYDTSDLQKILGTGRGRISEILNKRRSLSLKMIRRVSDGMKIPASVLIKDYKLSPKSSTHKKKQSA